MEAYRYCPKKLNLCLGYSLDHEESKTLNCIHQYCFQKKGM